MNGRTQLAIYVLIQGVYLKAQHISHICPWECGSRSRGPGCGSKGLAIGERGLVLEEKFERRRSAYSCCSVEDEAIGSEIGGSAVGEEPLDQSLVFD